MLNFMDEARCILGFSLAPGVGPKRFQNLLKAFGSAKDAWEGDSGKFEQAGVGKVNFKKFDAFRKTFVSNEYRNKLRRARVEFVEFGSKYYHGRLAKIDSPPIGLFIKGNKKLLLELNTIAVVGTRKITSYGLQVTSNLVGLLVEAGFVIVSGMAMGVDGVAHKTAIENSGSTIAVLGCGVDCPYPRENEKLYEEILDSGGLVISEYPLSMPASPGTFPARNRIIAGLSRAVLITEAAEDSGSLITASNAASQGKIVFAVPGPITSRMSDGTLKLLKQGAVLVQTAQDITGALNIKNKILNIKNTYQKLNSLKLTKEERKIFKALENEGLTIGEIIKQTEIRANKLSVLLSEMEIKGLIKNTAGTFHT